MQTMGELFGAGLVAYMFYSLANQGVKNSGPLDMGSAETPSPSVRRTRKSMLMRRALPLGIQMMSVR